jgi:FG-GAP-like repeat
VDYNGDGRLDFLTGSISGKVYLYRRRPDGTFGLPEVLKREVRGWIGTGSAVINAGSPSAVAMADWFDQGRLDLFIGVGDGHVYIVPNEGSRRKPVFRRIEPLMAAGKPIIADGGMAGPCVADWDRDGRLDLLVGCASGRVVWFRNIGTKGKPRLAPAVTLVDPFDDRFLRNEDAFDHPKRSALDAKICVTDWNGDGLPDLVVGDYSYFRGETSARLHGWVWVYLRKPSVQTAELGGFH